MLGRWFDRAAKRQERHLRALDAGRAAVESIIGLPHVLAAPVVARHFGQQAQPSDEAFRTSGRNGAWTLPSASPDLEVTVRGDDTGRLVLGLVSGRNALQGLVVWTEWNRMVPQSEWQIRLEEPAGEAAKALYRHLTGADPDAGTPD